MIGPVVAFSRQIVSFPLERTVLLRSLGQRCGQIEIIEVSLCRLIAGLSGKGRVSEVTRTQETSNRSAQIQHTPVDGLLPRDSPGPLKVGYKSLSLLHNLSPNQKVIKIFINHKQRFLCFYITAALKINRKHIY